MSHSVSFLFRPGLRQDVFTNVRLGGFWDAHGVPAAAQTLVAMAASRDETGCVVYAASAALDDGAVGQTFRWRVVADGPAGRDRPVTLEVGEDGEPDHRFMLAAGTSVQVYDLTIAARLGANLIARPDGGSAVRFAVYAPNARAVELAIAATGQSYISDDGAGTERLLPMSPKANGIWAAVDPDAREGTAYMYKITRDDGSIAYRSDLFSRAQAGSGGYDPKGAAFGGKADQLDGTKSCSLVCDPTRVHLADGTQQDSDAFWADEFTPDRPLPTSVQDLVIYELHVGALGFGHAAAGTLDDAIDFIPHLVELGINAVELLPIAEFQGDGGWGYSTSHFAAIEASAGGADRLKHFVRACHRHGIAVILDVVYNHYDSDAERAEWMYDTVRHDRNFCYWFEGKPSDYPTADGGYVDNESTGYAPNYADEVVRQLFISSAVSFVIDLHIDGFRVDQTTSIHAYPKLHADGRSADHAKAGGVAFLRQWTQTLRTIKPTLFLMAEDHSGWDRVTMSYEDGGLGFHAAWYADFYHHLVDGSGGWAKLLRSAGYGDSRPLDMSDFAGALRGSADSKVVYNDSHDEAGNSQGSARTLVLAVNFAPLVGETRRWAEARAKVAAGLALLSAGTPMFFMGEEVGAQEPYRYDDFRAHREDIVGLKRGTGAHLFAFYRDLIALSRGTPAIRSRNIEILAVDDGNRLIAFRRWSEADDYLVIASFADRTFDRGYRITHPSLAGKRWRKVLDSDAAIYGGWARAAAADVGDAADVIEPLVPAASITVFARGAPR